MVPHLRYSLALLFLYSSTSLESNLEKNNSIDINLDDIRTRRQVNSLPLVFPYGGSNKFIIGLGYPVPMREKYINMAFGFNFQYQYPHFDNVSALSKYYFIKTVSREQRDVDLFMRRNERITFYRTTAELLDAKGFNGQQCVLRAICEVSQYPVYNEALIGEVIHILLTPDYGHSPFEEQDEDWLDAISLYRDAATAGRQMFDCAYIYSGCPEAGEILELISQLRNE